MNKSTDFTTTSDVSLQYNVTALDSTSNGATPDPFKITATDLIRAEESLSSLYSYELKVQSDGNPLSELCHDWLGKRVQFDISRLIKEGKKRTVTSIRTIYGIVTSVISGPVELYESSDSGWYKLVIGPAFESACYSRNRAVYLSDDAPSFIEDTDEPYIRPKNSTAEGDAANDATARSSVLVNIAKRWGTDCSVTDSAKARIPDYLQLVQNDESDYNFFCRLLSTWGLGYCWQMDASTKKEKLYVYDVLGGEDAYDGDTAGSKAKEPLACMYSRGDDAPGWHIHCGYHNLNSKEMGVQNYLYAFKEYGLLPPERRTRLKLSLHDETWDQLQSSATEKEAYSTLHFLNRHFNAGSVHSRYTYLLRDKSEQKSMDSLDDALQLRMGGRMTWALSDKCPSAPSALDNAPYFLTKRVMSGDRWSINIEFSGRAPQQIVIKEAQGNTPAETRSIGCGILPRPLEPNADPDLDETAPLLQGVAWDTPKPRTFMAVVVSNVPHVQNGRNFCRVRELNGEEMWVEMGSPSADSNSGILARPRVNNVLFCMDRGDLSIPIVLSAMFRGKDNPNNIFNTVPHTKLKVMDRHDRTNDTTWTQQDENSALTLRSRTHVPLRERTSGEPLKVYDKDISADDLTFVQRPQSVSDLAAEPKPFNQIQMFSLDNGVKPVEQSEAAADWAIADAVVETTAGFFSEADFSAGYAGCDTSEAIQSARNIPVSRPHLQGISMYSSGDMINQSADHQIMNAGGEIVLTAAQAITLRVGKSYIRISEYGIDISSTLGKAIRPGAYPAYHEEDESERDDTLDTGMTPLGGGHIRVTCGGISNKGPYISNNVVNMFTASTFLGSSFTLSDFSSKLYAPAVTIIGGAALETTVSSLIMNGVGLVQDAMGSFIHSPVYTGSLYNGYKTSGADLSSIFNGLVGLANNAVQFGLGICNAGANLKNLVNPTGSLIKMLPERMTISSDILFETSATSLKTSSAAAGFIATTENAMFSLAKQAKFGWTVAKMAGVTVNKIISSISGALSGGSDATDTYTYEGEKPSDDVNSFSSSGAGIAEIAVDVATGIGAVILSLIPNPTEAIAASLFGSSKANALGLKNSMTLDHNDVKVNHATAVGDRNDAIAASVKNIASTTNNFVANNNNFSNDVQNKVNRTGQIVTETRAQTSIDAAATNMNASRGFASFTIATGTYNETFSSHV